LHRAIRLNRGLAGRFSFCFVASNYSCRKQRPAAPWLPACCLFSVLLFSGDWARGQETDERNVKKTDPPARLAEEQLLVPLLVDGQERGEVHVRFRPPATDVRVEAAPIFKELAALTTPETLSRLRSASDPQGYLSLQVLNDIGLDAGFNERTLEFRLAVPPPMRKPTEIEIYSRRPPPGAEKALAPSAISGFLNLRSGLDYVQQSQTGEQEGRQPVRVDVEGAINFRNWVIEAAAAYTEGAHDPFQRGDARLVRDDVENRLRYSLGDLAYPVTGFQNFLPMGGFTVARNFSLQPYRVTEPLGRTSFFLRNASKVEVFVNGRSVQSLNLQPGQHNLRDFLFVSGANDVVLRITDDVGRVETIQLSFFFDTRLLAQGEHEFAYSIGEPTTVTDGRYRYGSGTPSYSVFHRYGLKDTVTLGLNMQGDGVLEMGGAETVWASSFGTFQAEAALSRASGFGVGSAAGLQYRYYDASIGNALGSIYSVSAQYRGRNFGALGDKISGKADAIEFSARYSQRLPWQSSAGLGGSYQHWLGAGQDTSGVNLFVSKRWGWDFTTDLTLERNRTLAGQTDYRAFLSLIWLFPKVRQSVSASHDTLTGLSRLEWQYTPPRDVSGLTANGGVQRTSNDYQTFGNATYTGYRAETSVSEDITTPSQAGARTDVRSRFRFGTALVFADGEWGISRPIRDSFAIVVPHPSLRGQTIGLEPINGTYAAKSDWLGPAVLPDLQAYQVRQVITEAPNLRPGYDLGPDIHLLRPSYKSGTVIRVGTDASVIITGSLATAAGQPVPLQGGEVVALGDSTWKALTMFTDRNGRFHVEGLKPGAYELRLFADPKAVLRFEIPKGKTGEHALGALKLPAGIQIQ